MRLTKYVIPLLVIILLIGTFKAVQMAETTLVHVSTLCRELNAEWSENRDYQPVDDIDAHAKESLRQLWLKCQLNPSMKELP